MPGLRAAPAVTQEQLLQAWRQCRGQTWPTSFEDAMGDPVLSRLVQITALHPHQPQQPQLRVVRHPWPFMAKPYVPKAPARPVVFDCKRAAAGDRDD